MHKYVLSAKYPQVHIIIILSLHYSIIGNVRIHEHVRSENSVILTEWIPNLHKLCNGNAFATNVSVLT